MPLTTKRATSKTNPATPLNNVRIRRTKTPTTVPMLTAKIAPAGVYASKIVAVTASKIDTTNADAVDVTYELTGTDGKIVQGRVRYEVGGYHLDKLLDALAEAGVPEGSSITEAVGIEEQLEIVYPQRGSLAKIKSRRPMTETVAPKKPAAKPKAPTVDTDEDEEYDDFLDEDD